MRKHELLPPVTNGQHVNAAAGTPRPTTFWRVAIVAESVISREGMAAILRRDARFELSAGFGPSQSVPEIVASQCPDLVLVEAKVENADAFRWIKAMAARCPGTRILVVSERAERVYAECALRAGAAGYFIKTGSAAEFLQTVQAVVLSGATLRNDQKNVKRIAPGLTTRTQLAGLSERELEVFSLIATGHGTGHIATQLGISRKTVEAHCEHIKVKLEYRDAKELKLGARQMLGGRSEK